MFKKLRSSLLVLTGAAALLLPVAGMTATYPEHSDHVRVQFDIGHGFRHCGGFYDRWGHWHPYHCRW